MEFAIDPSPIPEVVLSPYDSTRFPKFSIIFERGQSESLLRFLAQPPDEANRALVMENRAGKDITALRYRWLKTSANGNVQKHTISSDSYMVDVFRPVLKSGDRKLISPATSVDESFIEHLLSGGGGIGVGTGGRESLVAVSSLRFEIDMVLFADGELAGPDPDRFAAELQCRKPAAEFIAKQVRLSDAEQRDVTPVISALAEVPCLRDDFLAQWTRRYAAEFLRCIGNDRRREAQLRHLESRPILPNFYRRDNHAD